MATITADDIRSGKDKDGLQELTKQQRIAFKLNPLFDGVKVPAAIETVHSSTHANKVALSTLLRGIDETALHFIRLCLTIDGKSRVSTKELLAHPFFSERFKNAFGKKFEEIEARDRDQSEHMASCYLVPRNGKEISVEEVNANSSSEEGSKDNDHLINLLGEYKMDVPEAPKRDPVDAKAFKKQMQEDLARKPRPVHFDGQVKN